MAISHISGKADVFNKLDINVTNFAKLECLRPGSNVELHMCRT